MRIVWRRRALDDLRALHDYVAKDDPRAAQRVGRAITTAVARLANLPHMGRPGRISGTRELIVSRTLYVIPYRVKGDEAQILRVYHAARRWPDRL